MGQYHIIVNLDKNEYLHAHRFNEGVGLLEQAQGDGAGKTVAGLFFLLACSGDGRGGGDARAEWNPPGGRVLGRWAGDRVAVVGDYTENDDLPAVPDAKDLYSRVQETGADISALVIEFLSHVD